MKKLPGSIRLFLFGLALAGCAAGPVPMLLTYPLSDADYGSIPDLRALADRAAPYYVKVLILDRQASAGEEQKVVNGASGIVVDETGHIVTVAHIALDVRHRASVTAFDGNTYPAEVIRVDPANELALLRSLVPLRVPAPPGYRVEVQSGEPVFAIGTPAGVPASVTVGHVKSPRAGETFRYHEFGFDDPIVLSMHVEPGYSGGPVFDAAGRLVGMVVGFKGPAVNDEPPSEEEAYAIPARRLFEYLRRVSKLAGDDG